MRVCAHIHVHVCVRACVHEHTCACVCLWLPVMLMYACVLHVHKSWVEHIIHHRQAVMWLYAVFDNFAPYYAVLRSYRRNHGKSGITVQTVMYGSKSYKIRWVNRSSKTRLSRKNIITTHPECRLAGGYWRAGTPPRCTSPGGCARRTRCRQTQWRWSLKNRRRRSSCRWKQAR